VQFIKSKIRSTNITDASSTSSISSTRDAIIAPAGESTRNIASALHHSQSQITCVIQAFKGEGQTTIAPRSGRPSALNDRDVSQVKRITKNRDKPIEQITDSVNECLSTSICSATIRNYLHGE
ncbi:8875_t:CDS:2, partial [Entrophospora sp. SA101]